MRQHYVGDFPQHAGRTIEQLFARCAGPTQVQSIEDTFLLEKTASLRRPGETILAFCGRVGLGPRALREWKLDRIRDFVAAAERNNADSEPEPRVIKSDRPLGQPGVVYIS